MAAAVYPNIKTPSAASRHKSMKDDRIVSCIRFLENVTSGLNVPSTLFMTDNTVSDRLQGSVTCSLPGAVCQSFDASPLSAFLTVPRKTGKPFKICAKPVIQAVFGSVHCDFLADSLILFI